MGETNNVSVVQTEVQCRQEPNVEDTQRRGQMWTGSNRILWCKYKDNTTFCIDLHSWFFQYDIMGLHFPLEILSSHYSAYQDPIVQVQGPGWIISPPQASCCLKLGLFCCLCLTEQNSPRFLLVFLTLNMYLKNTSIYWLFKSCWAKIAFLPEMRTFLSILYVEHEYSHCIFSFKNIEMLFDIVCHWVRISKIQSAS